MTTLSTMTQIEFGSPEAAKILEHDRKLEKNLSRIEELKAAISTQEEYLEDLRDEIYSEEHSLERLKQELRNLV